MTIEPVHEAGRNVPATGEGVELEELGECIAELAAQISAATYELLAMLRDFDERGGASPHRCGGTVLVRPAGGPSPNRARPAQEFS
jgi:hypothetical protein